jgi:FSR family fosmidomycin resistance protein-like MFS transporter
MLGGELARSVGPLIILGAISLWGMEGTYRMIPLGLGASILLFLRLKNVEIRSVRNSSTHSRTERPFKQFAVAFTEMRRLFLFIAGVSFSRAIITRALNAFLPTYLTAQGNSLWFSGLSLSLLELGGAAGIITAGPVSDRIGRRKTLVITRIASPIMMVLFLLTEGYWQLPVLITLGLFSFASSPITLALVQENAREHPAAANGVIMTMYFIFGASSVLLVGFISDWLGLSWAYWICTGLSLVGIPCAFLLPKER